MSRFGGSDNHPEGDYSAAGQARSVIGGHVVPVEAPAVFVDAISAAPARVS